MIYQALVGALPFGDIDSSFVERMQGFAQKAVREAKLQTSWLNPNQFYEDAIQDFLKTILSHDQSTEFLESLRSFTSRTSLIGALNSISQVTLKTMIPGVPDLYRGTELWDFSLVDPDNRRPVDFGLLSQIQNSDLEDWPALAKTWQDGRLKFALTHKLLSVRRDHAELFTHGRYVPLDIAGRHADHIIAFARILKQSAVVVVTMRGFAPFTNSGHSWPDFSSLDASIELSGFELAHRAVSSSRLHLDRAFGPLPVAVIPAGFRGEASKN